MSDTVTEADFERALNEASLLNTRGVRARTEAQVTGAAFLPDSSAAAFTDGDGAVHIVTRTGSGWATGETWGRAQPHDGVILSLTALPGGFVTGGDDGRICLTPADGAHTLVDKGRGWVGHLASWAPPKAKSADRPVFAASRGKTVELRSADGTLLKTLMHGATVEGVAIDAKGKRVFAAHYGGVSMWFIHAKTDSARLLEWKGSHIEIAVHPQGDAVVTGMQENALHGWTLPAGGHLRMAGYPSKPLSLSFSRSGKWLASSGADGIVLWPFHGGGPAGKIPTELASIPGTLATRVAFHPVDEIVACGYADGTVVLAQMDGGRLLPVCGTAAGLGTTTALAFSPDGTALAVGGEDGVMAVIDLTTR